MGIKTFMKGWGETGLGGGRSGPAMQIQRPQPVPGKLWSEYCLSELLSIGPKRESFYPPAWTSCLLRATLKPVSLVSAALCMWGNLARTVSREKAAFWQNFQLLRQVLPSRGVSSVIIFLRHQKSLTMTKAEIARGKNRKGKEDHFKIYDSGLGGGRQGKIFQEVSIINICLYRVVIASTSFISLILYSTCLNSEDW